MNTRGEDRVIAWAHNSHVGNAAYTHLENEDDIFSRLAAKKERELNVGQLAKEAYGQEGALIVGQLTNTGTVIGKKKE